MKNPFLRLAALVLLLALAHGGKAQPNGSNLSHSSLPTLARVIKIYSYNGPSRKKAAGRGCLDSVPLGCVSFKTTQTWEVGEQIWSDVVEATRCKKDDYDPGNIGYNLADCRHGNDFSGQMVVDYKDKLCTDGWRVPTKSDFISLDTALGGTGGEANDATLFGKYRSDWGFSYDVDGFWNFWSQSPYDADNLYALYFHTSGNMVKPCSEWLLKGYGNLVRCVRDKK